MSEHHKDSESLGEQQDHAAAPEQPVAGQKSPGELLRAAREARNMSVEELTGHTMLSRATVQALEENDFGRLSQPVFVRGYYRKCAKVLEMPEDELMAAYAARTGVEGPKPASPRQVDVVPQDVTPDGRRMLAAVLLGVAVVAGMALWFALPALQQGAGDSSPVAISEDRSDSDALAETLESAADTLAAPEPESTAGTPVSQDAAQVQSSLPTPQLQKPAPAERLAGDEPAGSDSPAQTEAPLAPGGLHFRFNQASWVDIRNGNGKRLLGGIVDGDSEYTYPAEDGPFDVRLGYTPGIEMYVNGQAFDLDAKTDSDNTARFILQIP